MPEIFSDDSSDSTYDSRYYVIVAELLVYRASALYCYVTIG